MATTPLDLLSGTERNIAVSAIVLDAGGAEALHGKGDLLASLGRGVTRAQAALLSDH